MTKRALILLRSPGTDLGILARALRACGYAEFSSPAPQKGDGTSALNHRMLKALGSTWDQPGPWIVAGHTLAQSNDVVMSDLVAAHREAAAEAIRANAGEQEALYLADPLVTLFHPVWRAAFEDLGLDTRAVVYFCNPLSAATALKPRDLAARHAFRLWHLSMLRALAAQPDNVASEEQLLLDPVATLVRIVGAQAVRPGKLEHAKVQIQERASQRAPERRREAASVDDVGIMSRQTKDLFLLLRGWDTQNSVERRKEVDRLQHDFDEAMLLVGPLKHAQARPRVVAAQAPEPDASPAAPVPARPFLVLHYHLFKNAGTSIDEMLKRNFGARWESAEFKAYVTKSNVDAVETYLREHPELLALSSHTASLPLPKLPGIEIFPIVLLRHPIARIKSAYTFERQQAADTFGAKLAKERDLAGYVETLLGKQGQRQARNFQTHRLALNEPQNAGSELARAQRSLESLPFVGLVEAYEESLARLQALLAPHVPGFEAVSVRRNATRSKDDTLDAVLKEVEHEIGGLLYKTLLDANQDDLALFEMVRAKY